MLSSMYGICSRCERDLEPVWFEEEEFKRGRPTGRTRRACSHLECPVCLKKECIDDTFDGPWR